MAIFRQMLGWSGAFKFNDSRLSQAARHVRNFASESPQRGASAVIPGAAQAMSDMPGHALLDK